MKIILLFVVLLTASCAIQDINQSDGMIWEKSTDGPIVAGLEKKDNNLFAADAYGSIYSFWIDSGSIRWKRSLTAEQITSIFPDTASLIVVSHTSDTTTIRRYSYEEGMILYQTNIPMLTKGSIYGDSDNIAIHSDQQVLFFHLRDNTYSITDLSPYTSSISAVVKDDYYYIIDSKCNVLLLDQFLNLKAIWRQIEGNTFAGSAFFLNNSLFLTTDSGIKILSPGGSKQEFSIKTDSTPIYYDAASSSLYLNSQNSSNSKAGIGRYNLVFNNLSENWFCPTFASITYSPVFVSSTLSAAAAVDNYGYLNIVNKQNGHFILSKYIGAITKAGLKFQSDAGGKAAIIPVTSPARIVCFSIEYAFLKAR